MAGRAPDYGRKRRAVIEAAASVFARRGYRDPSFRLVAFELGGSERAVSHYFRDKADLFTTVLDTHLLGLLEATDGRFTCETSAQGLETLCLGYAAYAAAHEGVHALLRRDVHLLPPERQADLRVRQNWILELFRGEVEQAVPAARARPDYAQVLAMSLLAVLNDRQHWFHRNGAMDPETHVRLLIRLWTEEGAAAALPPTVSAAPSGVRTLRD